MVIKPGSAWGTPLERPENLEIAASDADAARLAGEGVTIFGLAAGDLLTTLGGSRPRGATVHGFVVDLGWACIDGGERQPFIAHLIARRRAWSDEWAAVMNAAWYRRLYLGPRAHPNDGLLDVTHGALPARERVEARRRARVGTHLPHPNLTMVRRAEWSHCFERPIPIYLDGQRVDVARSIQVEIEPDALTIVL